MANPVITRLGINQFWYNHWFSKNSYASNTMRDSLNEEFIKNYINYGATYNTNIFMHEYWYSKNLKKKRTYSSQLNMQYFRRQYYSNNIVGIEHSYLIRHNTQEYFPLRTWFMRFNNWVIISVQWFKPNKTKASSALPKIFSSDVGLLHSKLNKSESIPTRTKLQHAKLVSVLKKQKLSYSF